MRNAFKAAFRRPSLILVCVLSVALGFSLAVNMRQSPVGPAIAAAPSADAMKDWRAGFVDIAATISPSVVHITSEKMVERSFSIPGLDDFPGFGPFGPPRGTPRPEKQLEKASGSGFIIRSDGYILTNNHVVAGADRVEVKLADGREFKGTVLTDERTDLALVKIDATGLPAIEFADSDNVKVGQWAITMGSPFGLRNTMTVGVVSAVRKEIEPNSPIKYPETIQTDASINFGNSGGPLVDINGRVIGINFMIFSRSGGNVGIGFAIPSNVAKFVVDQLIDNGKVVRGYLGVEPRDLTPILADKLGVKEGALVGDVTKDSAADKGGIEVKDVILKVDGKPVRSAWELRHVVQSIAPGTEVKVVVMRDGKQQTLSIKLDEAPRDEETSAKADGEELGLSVQPLTKDLADEIGVDPDIKGVVVRKVEPGSAGDRADIEVKDVIVEIDNTPIQSVAEFTQAVKKLKSGDTAIVVVQREKRSVILEMPVE